MDNILLEALNDFQKKYVDEYLGGDEYDSSKSHVKMFDSYEKSHPDRIKFDMGGYDPHIIPPYNVVKHLYKHGYEIHDYNLGTASKTFTDINGNEKKQYISIGKVLHRTGADKIKVNIKNADGNKISLLDEYTSSRNNKDYDLVISRDKHDIAGMSTDRHWESCMTLPSDENAKGGKFHTDIIHNFKHGSLVAYVVKKGDDNIEKPIARMLINKFHGKDGNVIYRTDNEIGYGNHNKTMSEIVNHIMKTHYPSISNQKYTKESDIYDDGSDSVCEHLGILKLDDRKEHYNQNNKLHDYIDENGNHRPAVDYGISGGEYYKNGLLHRDGDNPAVDIKRSYNLYGEPKTNHVIRYYKNDLLHRDGDEPASIEIKNDVLQRIQYFKHGMIHRQGDKPSETTFVNNLPQTETYYNYGSIHRDGDKPAIIAYHKGTFNKSKESYYKNDSLHRDGDNPAEIGYNSNGDVISEAYYKNGELHRDNDKPASTSYYTDGKLYSQIYSRNGLQHREDYQPSEITYDQDGNVVFHSIKQEGVLNSNGIIPSQYSFSKTLNDTREIKSFHKNNRLYSFNGEPSQIDVTLSDDGNKHIVKTWHDDGAMSKESHVYIEPNGNYNSITRNYDRGSLINTVNVTDDGNEWNSLTTYKYPSKGELAETKEHRNKKTGENLLTHTYEVNDYSQNLHPFRTIIRTKGNNVETENQYHIHPFLVNKVEINGKISKIIDNKHNRYENITGVPVISNEDNSISVVKDGNDLHLISDGEKHKIGVVDTPRFKKFVKDLDLEKANEYLPDEHLEIIKSLKEHLKGKVK